MTSEFYEPDAKIFQHIHDIFHEQVEDHFQMAFLLYASAELYMRGEAELSALVLIFMKDKYTVQIDKLIDSRFDEAARVMIGESEAKTLRTPVNFQHATFCYQKRQLSLLQDSYRSGKIVFFTQQGKIEKMIELESGFIATSPVQIGHFIYFLKAKQIVGTWLNISHICRIDMISSTVERAEMPPLADHWRPVSLTRSDEDNTFPSLVSMGEEEGKICIKISIIDVVFHLES